MSSKKHIFLSYSRKDSKFSLKLVIDLKKNKFNIWVDQIDIPSGEPWDDNIEKALDSAYALLLIISPDSANSSRVKDEVSYALEKEISIIPILYKNASISYRWKRLQFIELNEKNYNREIDNFIQKLNHINIHNNQLEENFLTSSTTETHLNDKTKPSSNLTYKPWFAIVIFLILSLGFFIYLENKNTVDNYLDKNEALQSCLSASKDAKKLEQVKLDITNKVIKNKINSTAIDIANKNTKRLHKQHTLESEQLPDNNFAIVPSEATLIEQKIKVHNNETSSVTLKTREQTVNKNRASIQQNVSEQLQTPKRTIDCSGLYLEQCERLKQNDKTQLVINIHTKQVDKVGNEQEKAKDIVNYLKRKGFHRSRFVVVIHKDGADKLIFNYRE